MSKLNEQSSALEIQVAIDALPELSRTVYDAIETSLYAEAYFSDVEWSDIIHQSGCTKQQVSGVAKKLVETGLVYLEDADVNGKQYDFVHALAHDLEVGSFA